MTRNMSATDRVIRTVIGLGIFVILLMGVITGTFGVILGIIAAILLLTSAVGFCPMYAAINFSTRRKAGAASK